MHGLLCLHVSDCCSCESPLLLQYEMLISSQRVYMNVLTLEELLQLIRRGEGGAVEVFLSVASSIAATGASPLSLGVDRFTALITLSGMTGVSTGLLHLPREAKFFDLPLKTRQGIELKICQI